MSDTFDASTTSCSSDDRRCPVPVRGASVGGITLMRLIGGEAMKLEVGNRVKVESESTERTPRLGVIEEVIRGARSPRYRIRWDDGHESIYTPAAGAVSRAEPTETA